MILFKWPWTKKPTPKSAAQPGALYADSNGIVQWVPVAQKPEPPDKPADADTRS